MSALVPELQKRIYELEATVKQLTKDKDELYNDLERSLVRKDSSFWQSSNIHEERLKQCQSENQQLQEQLNRVTAQRDSFLDDNVQIQRVKHDADLISKEQIDANSALERELEFYKRQCAQALEERNAFASELEELKKAHLDLERDSVHIKEHLQTERRRREHLEGQIEEAVTRVQQLQERLVDQAKTTQLEGQFQTLQSEYKRLKFQLQHAQQNVQDDTNATGGSVLGSGLQPTPVNSSDQTQDNSLTVDQEKARDCDASQELENLKKALGLVEELVPRFKSIHEMVKTQSFVHASVGDSLAGCDQIQQAMNDLWNELDSKKIEEDSSNQDSLHISIGKEAIELALSCISNLKESHHSGV